ncbi:AsnC family transcriptional regulator [Piscinibacter sakaiensis]|uniref:AsnC family transcriptional regulator n=1 Tax=Piscinibacter sakaiensis TaxID=1547922 RepID=UPI003AB0B763
MPQPSPKKARPVPLDPLDVALLDLLQHDASLPMRTLADQVGTSPASCKLPAPHRAIARNRRAAATGGDRRPSTRRTPARGVRLRGTGTAEPGLADPVRNFKSMFAMNCSKFETRVPLPAAAAD